MSTNENEAITDSARADLRLIETTVAPLNGVDQADPVPSKTYDDVEWRTLTQQIAEQTSSPEGRELALSLTGLADRELAEARLREIAEYMTVLEEGEEAPIYGLRDIRQAVQHVAREGILHAEDLEAIARNGDVASRVRRFFRNRVETAPILSDIASRLDPCDELRQALNHAVEPGGRLSDHASPDLRRLRRNVQTQIDRIKTKVDQLLKSKSLEPLLQDDYFTVRDDRYVFPIRVSAKNALDGIVHGYSQSGQTAYVEPNELIELNNALRWTQIEVEEEEARILARLSNLVARHATGLEENTDLLAYLDLVVACAVYARSTESNVPDLSAKEVELKGLRHPLLFLKFAAELEDGQPNPTVANDLVMGAGERVLIVSGPNTGGKTVLIKAFGLAALMARAGLPVPAAEGSKLPFYANVFTDIGDEQSIDRDLSTFSSHLVNINSFLDRCDPTTLVLLDELFTGTDPLQGAALAASLLEELARKGATTLVTTHLEGLKTLALEDETFANASMGFDIKSLEPTYALTLGIPGSSFALRIAERLGFPASIVTRAKDVLEGEGRLGVDQVLAQLEDQADELRRERNRLQHERDQANAARKRYERRYAELKSKERDMVHDETRALRERIDSARNLVKQKVKSIKKDNTLTRKDLDQIREELEKQRDEIDTIAEKTRPAKPRPDGLVPVDADSLTPDMEVYAATFKRNATIVEVDRDRGEAQVQVGVMKTNVSINDLFYPTEQARRAHVSGRKPAPNPNEQERATEELLPQNAENSVDLRGLRVDEALEKMDLFLDAAFRSRQNGVYVIHGHGTGALKRAVRGNLPSSRYVRDWRPGERGEGGDGVTIAFVKRDL
jgi:DNA mismatch repair protein MutS2